MRIFVPCVLALIGCGDDPARHVPDAAPMPDGIHVDAPVDAAPQPVTVNIVFNGAPMAGITVHFQKADSSLVTTTLTDSSGNASAMMAAGGSVTAIDPYFPPAAAFGVRPVELYTFAGVKPGDHLMLHSGNPSVITQTVMVPADVSPTAGYTLYTSCSAYGSDNLTLTGGSSGIAAGTASLSACGATADLLVVSKNAAGDPVHFIYKADVAVNAAIDLTTETYVTAPSRDYTWTNVADVATIGVTDMLASTKGLVFQRTTNTTTATPTTMLTQTMPAFAGAIGITKSYQYAPSGYARRAVYEWAPYTTPYTTDYGAHLLPDFTARPAKDTGAHTFSWTENTGTAQPDFTFARLDMTRAGAAFNWYLVEPYTAGKLTFPAIPAGAIDYNIADTDNVYYHAIDNVKVTGGYDAVRAGVLSALSSPLLGPEALVFGSTGSISVNEYQNLTLARAQRPSLVVGSPANRR